jgi:hypothetical protein
LVKAGKGRKHYFQLFFEAFCPAFQGKQEVFPPKFGLANPLPVG